MTDPTSTDDAQLRRRGLLRGGALAAVAAGAVVAGTARPAAAANGGNVVIGPNEGTVTTTLKNTTTARNAVPPLTLANADGPALQLQALDADWDGQLKIGQVVGTTDGPLVGVDAGDGTTGVTDYLATGLDLALLPVPIPNDPKRLLDTRIKKGVYRKSSGAINSKGQLVKGGWIDVRIPIDDPGTTPIAAYVNLTVVSPTDGGYVTVYPGPATKPTSSTLNFRKSVTIANGAFVGTLDLNGDGVITVRIYASVTTHVLLDLTGTAQIALPADAAAAAQSSTARTRSQARASRKRRAALRRGR